MKKMGVPYPDGYEQMANKDLVKQEDSIRLSLQSDKIKTANNKEIIALIAYLQRMGKDIKANPKIETVKTENATSVFGN